MASESPEADKELRVLNFSIMQYLSIEQLYYLAFIILTIVGSLWAFRANNKHKRRS
jgi:hypothetical protein